MSNFIITGATGFVGSKLLKKLVKEGHTISIISRKNSKYDNIQKIKDKLNIFEYDGNINKLIEFFTETNADIVIHVASLCIVENKPEDVDKLIDSNIKFSTQILESMKHSNCKKIINTSTFWQHYNNEDYNPVCLYAATKEAFENIMKFYCEAYGIKCISLELFDTYGENDNRPKIMNLLKQCAENGIELNMSKGEQVLDLLYIDDVIDGYLRAIEIINENNNKIFEKYSLQSKNRVTLKELVKIFEDITQNQISINWDKRPYRNREVMIPWNRGKILPNWEAKVSLEEGIKKSFFLVCKEGEYD